ncbi:VOC family protein [Spirosoma aureum]|uniref:VOC family protein n=1 Tax=Spirosoma aureum TaxID=2692134 RepID=A0A6G9AVU8_9BACT|nr:VOC family protein [Spirosoma aureum]QIP16466.1 VOC family protein [Spirosoma aureum]
MATLNPPYLNFNGNCEEAFTFYKSVFGGEFASITRYKDAPSENPVPENEAEKIANIGYPIGQGGSLMGSDVPESYGKAIIGTNVYVPVNTESEEEATRLFNGLSVGGQVMMPLDKTFWNAYFGMFTDKFGVQWMISYDYNQ